MNDLIFIERYIGIAFDLLIYIIMMRIGWNVWKKPQTINKTNFRIFIILTLIICVFNFYGDYEHYYNMFTRLKGGKLYLEHLEIAYRWTIPFVNGEYFLWRFIIWGLATLITIYIFKNLSINPFLALFIYLSFGMAFYTNGRVSLAMAVLFLGLAIMLKNKATPANRFWGILLIFSTVFLHKSAGFGIFVIILSLICRKINKYSIIISFLLIPVIIILIKSLLPILMSVSTSSNVSDPLNTAQRYIEFEFEYGIGLMLQQILSWLDLALWTWIIIKLVKTKVYYKFPIAVRIFINFAFFSILISSLFFFDFGFDSKIIQLRFSEFAYIPAAIMLTICRMCNFSKKLITCTVKIGLIQCGYHLTYIWYCSYVANT